MKKYLLDTGIAGDFIKRRADVEARVRESVEQGHRVGICTPILGELWAGVENSATAEPNRPLLRDALRKLRIWPFDIAAAEEFGRLFAELRRIGRPMQQIDIQIAAVARTLGNCTIVTKDSDFSAIPNIEVVDWSKC